MEIKPIEVNKTMKMSYFELFIIMVFAILNLNLKLTIELVYHQL